MRIEGTEKLLKVLNSLSELHAAISRRLADTTRSNAERLAPARTGRLRRSIRVVEGAGGYVVLMGGHGAPYAQFVEYGSRPHIIRARRAMALRFEVRGEVVYAKYVRHPGTRAQRILARAMEESLRELDGIVSRILMRKIL